MDKITYIKPSYLDLLRNTLNNENYKPGNQCWLDNYFESKDFFASFEKKLPNEIKLKNENGEKDDLENIKKIKNTKDNKLYVQLIKMISDWCLDDNNKNILYKKNGDERYPNFKLYKMITRTVHRWTPESEIERELFNSFIVNRKKIQKKATIMNIDKFFLIFNKKK